MRATASCLGALLALGLTAAPGLSQHGYPQYGYPQYGYPQYVTAAYHYPIPAAPDACWGGFYTMCPHGTAYGPNYALRPPFAPFQGPIPPHALMHGCGAGGQQQQQQQFRFNPYVRSPRDFFMWGDMMDEQAARERRPALVP